MQALVRAAEVTGDPSAPVLQGLASVVDAMHVMTTDVRSQNEAARKAIPVEELRKAVARGISAHAVGIARSINRTALITGITVSAVALAGTFCAGYVYHGNAVIVAGVRAGDDMCSDQPDGARLCYIPVYTRLPPARSGH